MGGEHDEAARLLDRWRDGEDQALDDLLPLVYGDLRRMARAELSRHRGHDTLQPTALVHDVFVRLLGHDALRQVEDPAHFFNLSARLMRQVLVARARAAETDKRGGDWVRDEFTRALDLPLPEDTRLPDLDRALERLASLQPRMAQVVELRCFGGFEVAEIAGLLAVDERTIYRDWATARAWLRRELES